MIDLPGGFVRDDVALCVKQRESVNGIDRGRLSPITISYGDRKTNPDPLLYRIVE